MANSNDKGRSGRSSREFNFAGFMWRFITSLALVVASYNPTQYSFWGWVYAPAEAKD